MSLKLKNHDALYCSLGLALLWIAIEILAQLGATNSPPPFLRRFWEAWVAGVAQLSLMLGYITCALWLAALYLRRRRIRRAGRNNRAVAPKDFRREKSSRWSILRSVTTKYQRPAVKKGLARARDLQGEPYL